MIIMHLAILLMPTVSQEKQHRITVDPHAGFAVPLNYDPGLSAGVNIWFCRDARLARIYSVDYSIMQEFTIWSSPNYTNQQLEFMIGKQLNLKFVSLYYSGGAGPVWGKRFNTSELENYFTGGISLATGWKFVPFKYIGIGADLKLNINPENPLLMLSFILSFGRQHFY